MQKTQNRWSIISLSITSSSLQQQRRHFLSSQKHPGLSDPGTSTSNKQKPHTWVNKDAGKPIQGFEELSAHSLSETGVGWELYVTSHGSRNRWGSLHLKKEPSLNSLQPTTKVLGGGREPRGPLSRMGPAWIGTQGWRMVPIPTTCAWNTLLSQHSSKQHYVKTKPYTSACSWSDM